MAVVLAVVNQKGGVGKSTTALNLSAALARKGRRILLVDLDPQGNATSGLGIPKEGLRSSVYDVLLRRLPLRTVLLPTSVDGLEVAPSTVELAGAEVELATEEDRESRLRVALEALQHRYDLVVVDCPPSLGLLTLNALVAADLALLPIQCEYYALEGLSLLLRTLELVQRSLNPQLRMGGVVLTMYDPRTNLSEQVAREVRAFFGKEVFRTVIPRTVRLAEAPSHGQPIFLYDPHSRGAAAYEALAEEVAERLWGEGKDE
ncbi:MAG: ParA family protein [Armatimonadota bacterium]|nr:ParA family protein [Armatimonadota bacterium]MDR7438905.1 ParA family protein [Armatimonadota bacterium]MDR7562445.1 ParA family protein [Armatimonadota bacterium]MDR7567033.1 ParA family protein [Armatimonadota bacterium]MDR7601158.1 ParA family protein [Armatimonadota bacterium]